jgi:hypothetical protein
MQYKGFNISAFEQEPGKWRATIFRRMNHRLSNAINQKLQELVSGAGPSSAVDALILAMEAIDLLGEISSDGPASMLRKRRRQHRAQTRVGLQKGEPAKSDSP